MREAARKQGCQNAADPAWRRKIAVALMGDKNPRWRGGVAVTPYAPGFSRKLKAEIRTRDQHTCQLCGVAEDDLSYALTIHHADYDKTNHDPSNLFSVCRACNSRVNSNREVWTGYFVALDTLRKLGKDVAKLIGRKIITQNEGLVSVVHDDAADLRDLFGR
jgi:hypothetical protein